MKSIKTPVLTEKSAAVMDGGLYVFAITESANKKTVAAELKDLYDVDAVSVRIVNLPAKNVNFKKIKGVRSRRRKAYVQLAAKQQIPGFEALKQDLKKQAEEMAKAEKAEEPAEKEKK